MAIHSDPTANAAIGAVSREWKQMVRRAIALRRTGREPTPEENRLFTGIYRQLLHEPLNELEGLNEKGRRWTHEELSGKANPAARVSQALCLF